MGYCWGSAEASSAPPGSVKLRVMTYNVKWGHRSLDDVAAEIVRNDPDILMIQDAGGSLQAVVGQVLKGRHIGQFGQYAVASKYPIDKLTVGYIPYQNETHTYVRTILRVNGAVVTLVDVHLVTPRSGLEAMQLEGEYGIGNLERNIRSRLIQTDKLVKDLADVRGPLILAGDLNAPVQSVVCKKLADAGLRDAFSTAGSGYGYTYGHLVHWLRHSYVRIDHIMVNDGLKVQKCRVGAPEGADHRPVIADLLLDARVSSKRD
jgi:endonuclease/exonuclease/phosphatase (EEP) superfamily protein YafD